MLPSLFISHGSPMLALEPGASGPALARLARELPTPKAIVIVSAHWESQDLRVSSGAQPETWHDFGGFPAALFAVQYPAPGQPELAAQVAELLKADGLVAQLDGQRPFDHGVWVPLSLMYPRADIPVVQVSLPSHAGAALQTRIGHALASLRQHSVLLIGSGSITHNLAELDWRGDGAATPDWALAFRQWMVHHLNLHDLNALQQWQALAPHAQRNHPTDEHLRPLFFACGAGRRFSLVHSSFEMGALGMDLYRFD